MILAPGSSIFLLVSAHRQNERLLAWAWGVAFFSFWLDKGIDLSAAAFAPSPLGAVTDSVPWLPEALIAPGVWAPALLLLTVLYRIVISLRAKSRLEAVQ